MKIKGFLKRVDIQVIILITIVVIFATLTCSIIMYKVTYEHTLDNIEHHALDTYDLVCKEISKSDFDKITSSNDVNNVRYNELQKEFQYISKATGITYIFTTFQDEEGVIRHHISNLTESSINYRYPGQVVDNQSYGKLIQVYNGDAVFPTNIKSLDIGHFYSFYFPLYENGEIIGAIGFIFDASRQYETYRNIRIFIPIIIILSIILASIIAYIIFKRISNPFYQDMANTDIMTGLKNRNAYQIDINNMIAKNQMKGIGVVVIDLNTLKKINDERGHDAGDIFICNFANAFKNIKNRVGIMYRIGGDEFIVLIKDASKEIIKQFLKDLKTEFYQFKDSEELSYSVGYAIYDETIDSNINKTIRRADELMYKFKRESK